MYKESSSKPQRHIGFLYVSMWFFFESKAGKTFREVVSISNAMPYFDNHHSELDIRH